MSTRGKRKQPGGLVEQISTNDNPVTQNNDNSVLSTQKRQRTAKVNAVASVPAAVVAPAAEPASTAPEKGRGQKKTVIRSSQTNVESQNISRQQQAESAKGKLKNVIQRSKKPGSVSRSKIAEEEEEEEEEGGPIEAVPAPSAPVPAQSGVKGVQKEGCTAFKNFREPQTLIPYEQSTKLLPETSGTRNILEILNICSNILSRQVFLTSELRNTQENNFLQQDLSCIDETETVRAQGLFDIGSLPSLEEITTLSSGQLNFKNLITDGNVDQKFAIPSYEGNPNGVLAVALYEAATYLNKLKQSQRPKEVTNSIIGEWLTKKIPEIFGASRKQGKSEDSSGATFTNTADTILTEFNKAIDPIDNIDKFVSIFKVYGPFLNKGLSDISQAGELSKFYVLKYIQERLNPVQHLPPPNDPPGLVPPGTTFWTTTRGLPSLSAYSSDTIASALGVRIQNLFKGQFQSICPRKHERGNFMVVYIPYNYMSLMYLIARSNLDDVLFSDVVRDKVQKAGLFDKLMEIKESFIEYLTVAVTVGEISLASESVFSDKSNFFISLKELVYNIYRAYKVKNNQPDNFFSENILSIIDYFIDSSYSFNEKERKNLIYYFDDFYALYAQISIIEFNQKLPEDKVRTLKSCFQTIKTIILSFGSMIERLQKLISNTDINKLLENIWLETGEEIIRQIELPTWTGILYSTISYYDNCLNFSQQTDGQLLDKFLDISKMEIKCAIQDVDKGHDQSAQQVGNLGEKFAREAVKLSQDELDLRPTEYYGHANNQKVFSKKLINTLKYCSVAIVYDIYGNPVLKVINSKQKDDSGNYYTGADYERDFMFDTFTPVQDPTRFVASISGIGSAENWGSIDYLKGKVPELQQSKAVLKNDFETYEDIETYFSTANIIELRFSTTNFDAAAPSGCLYRNVGNQCLSYLPIKINKKDYMYVILTIDLNRVNHQNSLELTSDTCKISVTPLDIFDINKEDIELKDISIAISKEIPPEKEPRNRDKKIYGIMLVLLNECYKLPEDTLKKQMETIFGKDSNIVTVFDNLNKLRELSISNKTGSKGASGRLKVESVLAFGILVKTIQEYYKKCKKSKQEDCLQNLKVFLTKLYSCLFSKDPPRKTERVEAISLEGTAEKKASAYEIAAGVKALQSLTKPPGAFNEGENKFSRAPSLTKPYFGSLVDPEHDIISDLEKKYNLDYRDASTIYREAKRYYQENYSENIASKSVSKQIESVIDFIEHVYNRDHPTSAIYKRSGGKRKTKKNKMYKNKVNKWNTKRIINKRVRKTKRRNKKGKRITRRR